MFLFKKEQLDERQLLIRGNIFKHGLFIAGYNMLPEETKAKMDVVKLSKFMGKVMLSLWCSAALLLAEHITGIEVLNTIALVILALSIIIALVWSNIHYMASTRK